uniref:Ovule protein n=1 Tax=Parascaris univalens TaxID=6257 RepID=A0A914ZYC9_PARUN
MSGQVRSVHRITSEFLRACMDDYSDTVRSRDELIIRDPKKQFVHWSQMFDLRPSTTLRLNQTLCELFVGSKRDLIVPALK